VPSPRPPRPPRGPDGPDGRPPRGSGRRDGDGPGRREGAGPGRRDGDGPPRGRFGPPRQRDDRPRDDRPRGPVVRTWQAPADEHEDLAERGPTVAPEEAAMNLTLPSALARRLRTTAREIGTDPESLAVVLLGQQVLALKD